MNPYGVRAMQPDREERTVRCRCCRLGFTYVDAVTAADHHYCEPCVEHVRVAGESDERRLARLEEHEPRIWRHVEDAREVAQRCHADAKAAMEQVSAALESRDLWRMQVTAAHAEHRDQIDGQCSCGAKAPCATNRAMQRAREEHYGHR